LLLRRSVMRESLGPEYIKLARLKGLPQSLVIAKHAFKNALIPVMTLAGINFVIMISVAVVVETVFAWPGVGRLLYEGITFRDFPVVQRTVLMLGAMTVIVNLVVDVRIAIIAPRNRLAGAPAMSTTSAVLVRPPRAPRVAFIRGLRRRGFPLILAAAVLGIALV